MMRCGCKAIGWGCKAVDCGGFAMPSGCVAVKLPQTSVAQHQRLPVAKLWGNGILEKNRSL
jgi:hypothetical protein